MPKQTKRSYDGTKNKLRAMWEDLHYLIAVMEQNQAHLAELIAKVDRVDNAVASLYLRNNR